MKTKKIVLAAALLMSTATSAQERLLTGGLSYQFSMTLEEAKAAGFRDPPDDEDVMRFEKTKTPGLFDAHSLFFTAKTFKLWKIQGFKAYGSSAKDEPPNCKADGEVLVNAIAQKYPGLARFTKGDTAKIEAAKADPAKALKEIPTTAFCESARPVSPTVTLGDRRCIEVACSAGGNLTLDYLDNDLIPQMKTELEAWRKENAAAELKKLGLDPGAL